MDDIDEFADAELLSGLDADMLDASRYEHVGGSSGSSQPVATQSQKKSPVHHKPTPEPPHQPEPPLEEKTTKSPTKKRVSPGKNTSPVKVAPSPAKMASPNVSAAPPSATKKRSLAVVISDSDEQDEGETLPPVTHAKKLAKSPAKKSPSPAKPTKKPASPAKKATLTTSASTSKTASPVSSKKPSVTSTTTATATTSDATVSPEKSRKAAFARFKSRGGPIAPGSKEIPIGDPKCLEGMSFAFTGELDAIGRDEAIDFVKRHGGRVVTQPSGKTSYVVVGRDPGPSKLKLIEDKKLKTVDEDGLLDLVRSRSKNVTVNAVPSAATNTAGSSSTAVGKPSLAAAPPVSMAPTGPSKGRKDIGHELWTVKYAPKSTKDIIGNKSNVESLSKWLYGWNTARKNDFKSSGRKDDVSGFRACLISGPPGIGKTTAAQLIAKEQGFDVVELNASDARNKASLDAVVKELIGNHSVAEYFKSDKTHQVLKKHLIIMDEVDGMGGGDRGGMAELILLIKKSKIPIICICNDRMSTKVRSLANYCLDLRFMRPSANQIRARIMSISYKEGFTIEPNAIDQLFQASHSDIRQMLNMLQNWSLTQTSMTYDQSKQLSEFTQKNVDIGPFDLAAKFFNPSLMRNMSLSEKMELYFNDYQLLPPFIQENYLRTNPGIFDPSLSPKQASCRVLDVLSRAADSISIGDLVDARIFGGQEFSLMPVHSLFSCVLPTALIQGHMSGRLQFPSILGQLSKANKGKRILKDLHMHMRLEVSADKNEIRQSYLPALIPRLTYPLIHKGTEGVGEVMKLLDKYTLTKDDWDMLLELGMGEWSGEVLLKQIPSSVKSAFTRQYNKADHALPYALPLAGAKKGRSSGGGGRSSGSVAVDFEEALDVEEDGVAAAGDGDGEGEEGEEEEDVQLLLKPKASAKGKKTATTTAKGSKLARTGSTASGSSRKTKAK